jgi:hypothetical protein
LLRHDNVPSYTAFFTWEFLTKNNMTVFFTDLSSSLFKRKQKDRHVDTTGVIEAESQAVLNILTGHDFQDAIKKMAEALRMVHTDGRGLTSRVMVASRPKVSC